MPIPFVLRPVTLANNPVAGLQMVRSMASQKVGKEALVRAVAATGTTVSKSDISAVLENLGEALVNLCSSGQSADIEKVGTVTPRYLGTKDADGNWVKAPKFALSFRFDKDLLKQFRVYAEAEQVPAQSLKPIITQLRNSATDELNKSVTPGALLIVKGKLLKVNTTRADEGVWLIPVIEGGTAVKIAKLVDNTYSRLTCEVPSELEQGTQYIIEIRTRKGGKTLVISSSETVLTVL